MIYRDGVALPTQRGISNSYAGMDDTEEIDVLQRLDSQDYEAMDLLGEIVPQVRIPDINLDKVDVHYFCYDRSTSAYAVIVTVLISMSALIYGRHVRRIQCCP
jgi:hypothetical protein